MDRDEMLKSFYTDICNEDIRLNSRVGSIEFITTTKYIDNVLKDSDSILEIGAGTGKYSVHYAKKGYRVNAIEIVPYNLEVLKSKITDSMNICAEQGDILDLSRFDDEQFDVTLVLGPMYHLFSVDDKKKALKEAVRVTKKGGYIFVAYVMNDSVIISYLFGERRIMEYKDKITEDFMCKSSVEELFDLIRLEGINEINKTQEIVREKIVATDGAASYMKDVIDSLSDEEYNLFLEYHLSTCERTDLIGATSHALDILIKE